MLSANERWLLATITGPVCGTLSRPSTCGRHTAFATGGSIVELLEKLAELGCTGASVACTHGLFVGKAVDRLRGHPMITEVVTTDTVPPPVDWPELKIRSVAELFAEAINRVHAGESISSLFDGVDPTLGPPQPKLPFPT